MNVNMTPHQLHSLGVSILGTYETSPNEIAAGHALIALAVGRIVVGDWDDECDCDLPLSDATPGFRPGSRYERCPIARMGTEAALGYSLA